MIEKFRKFSSTKIARVFIGIIILPFVMWGMGNIFGGGNQNTIAKIDNKSISVNKFIDYIRSSNIDPEKIRNDPNLKILDKLLYDFISNEILLMEAKKYNLKISNESMATIIKNQNIFKKDNKFSRTKYEKFLLERNMPATYYEQEFSKQKIKQLLFSLIGDGLIIPKYYINSVYNKRNKKILFSYIDLQDYYNSKIDDDTIQKFYNENEEKFKKEYIDIKYINITPEIITGQKEFSKLFFKKLDEIDELIINENTIEDISNKFNVKITNSDFFNKKGEIIKSNNKILLDDYFIKKIFENKDEKIFLLDHDDKYVAIEIVDKKNVLPPINENNNKDNIVNILKFSDIIKKNNILIDKINNKQFSEVHFKNFSTNNNLDIQAAEVKNINDTNVFGKNLINQIYQTTSKKIKLISSKDLKENYLILIRKVENVKVDDNFEKLSLTKIEAGIIEKNYLFSAYDNYLKKKYLIETNEKVLERVKNNFR